MAMLSALKDMNSDESGEPRWVDPKSGRPITPHGLRATFRTWGEDAGFPRDLLEESLGHQIGTAVERAYRRTDSFDRRRAIMQAFGRFLQWQACWPPGYPLGVKDQTSDPMSRQRALTLVAKAGFASAKLAHFHVLAANCVR